MKTHPSPPLPVSSTDVKLFTVREVAVILKISASKVYQLIARGQLAAHRIDGSLRISFEDLQALLRQCRNGQQTVHIKKVNPPLRLKHLRAPR